MIEKQKTTYFELSEEEQLVRQQLNILYHWQLKSPRTATEEQKEDKHSIEEIPQTWQLLKGVSLNDWQKECIQKWFDSGKRGVVKVVTGAGKTIMALGLAERLQNEVDRDLRIIVVVPTIVLMNQWYENFLKYSNLPDCAIGRLGGGYNDTFQDKDQKRVLITVLASASKLLAKNISNNTEISKHLLLTIDECHRAAATVMSEVFKVQRAYSLGLSATPEREEFQISIDNDDSIDDKEESEISVANSFDDSILGKELGPIIYELNFNNAIERGILPKFEIRHYGLPLTQEETANYESLSREITELREFLQQSSKAAGKLDGASLVGWARKVASNPNNKLSSKASMYVQKTTSRKQLLYHAKARTVAVIKFLEEEFRNNPNAKAILFHESINEVMKLFNEIRKLGNKNFKVVVEHSQLTESLRADSIELFRKNNANIIVSARSLIEGFDVPSVDVGIIVASSSSVRQRIQTLGRILRKHKSQTGEEKQAILHVLYIKGTTDEMIYEKNNWEENIGAERNRYFLFDPFNDKLEEQNGPPRRPLPKDRDIDPTTLKPGDVYFGAYEGEEYSCDSKGNIKNLKGQYVINPGNLPSLLKDIKGSFGTFKVTPIRKYVLVIKPDKDGWKTLYVARLLEDFVFQSKDLIPKENTEEWIDKNDKPGVLYPFVQLKTELNLKIKKNAKSEVISKKILHGESYAKTGSAAIDPEKGMDSQRIIENIKKLKQEGKDITTIEINELNHVLYRENGQLYFICKLNKGLEFPD